MAEIKSYRADDDRPMSSDMVKYGFGGKSSSCPGRKWAKANGVIDVSNKDLGVEKKRERTPKKGGKKNV